MPATLTRLILAITVLFATPMVYFITFFVSYLALRTWGIGRSEDRGLLAATLVSPVFLTVSWWLVWRSTVRWSPARVTVTLLVAGACVVVSSVAAVGGWLLSGRDRDVWMVVAGMVYFVLWLAGSTLAWRETGAERAERLSRLGLKTVACPKCGYNLTGLREARCPECGAQFTIDQLVADVLESRRENEVG